MHETLDWNECFGDYLFGGGFGLFLSKLEFASGGW